MITINEILKKLSKLNIEFLAGKQGGQNTIDYITILELPEKTNRFKKKGLILSTFQSFESTDQINEHIKWLQSVGIKGIGFHTAHYKEVPEDVIKYADNINIPLFKIPVAVPYHKILDIFNQYENENLNLKAHEIYKINEKILESIASNKEYGYIINLIGNYIKKNIIFLNNYLRVSAVWKSPKYSQEEMDTLTTSITSTHKEKLLQTRFFKREAKISIETPTGKRINFTIIPMSSRDKFLGYLIVDSKAMNDFYNKEVIKIGLKAMSLQSIPIQNSKDYDKTRDIQKFVSLINNTAENIIKDDFYISIDKLKLCVRVSFSSDRELNETNNSLNELLLEKNSNSLSWIFEKSIIIFIEHETDLSNLQDVLNLYSDKSVGISSNFINPTLNDIKIMNRQAVTALKHSEFHDREVSKWDDMGIERISYNIYNTELFSSIEKDVLGTLINYDRQKNAQLMDTLESCLKHFFNFKAVGEELYIHPNTVKYRLEQIKKLIKIDIYDYLNYSLLVTAFSIYNHKNN